MTNSDGLADNVGEGTGMCSISAFRPIHSKSFKPISILISVFAFSVAGAACGGSDKKDDEDVDSGIVVADSGVTDNDASITEDDAGIIEDNDASIIEDDAGIIDDDAGEIEDDGGIIEDNDASIDDAGIIEDDAGTEEEDIEVVSIPAGSFTLGHATGSHSSGDTVTLSAFALKKTPVTVAEFEKCVAAGECTSSHYKTVSFSSYCNYNRGNSWKNHPMNCIDWDGAKEYCEWIGGRLPTEEEWEYAATHNGTTHLDTTYPWGNNTPTHCVTAQYYEGSKYCQGNAAAPMSNTSYEGTSDVSLHSTAGDSPLGLVDMAGNVWEWTSSLFSSNGSAHLLKGGSWSYGKHGLPVSYRPDDDITTYRAITEFGFRCAK